MGFIRIFSTGLFKKTAHLESSFDEANELDVKYIKLNKTEISSNGKLILETDGLRYIRFNSGGEEFVTTTGASCETRLQWHGSIITFRWGHFDWKSGIAHHSGLYGVSYNNETFLIHSKKIRGYPCSEISSTNEKIDFVTSLGALAYFWTMEMNEINTTA